MRPEIMWSNDRPEARSPGVDVRLSYGLTQTLIRVSRTVPFGAPAVWATTDRPRRLLACNICCRRGRRCTDAILFWIGFRRYQAIVFTKICSSSASPKNSEGIVYEKFYNLSGPPFLLTPDPRFFFSSSNHKRAITHLVYGLDQREGFIVITGEVGAGKTMLVEQLWLQLNRNTYAVSKVVTTQVSGDDLLRLVMDGFGLNVVHGTEKSILLRRFEAMVREQRNASPPLRSGGR